MPLRFEIANRQRRFPFDLVFVSRLAQKAHPACCKAICSRKAPLRGLEEIEVSILSDKKIGEVHEEFFQDPSPTDVITFHHGEILIGAGIATENAGRYGRTPDEEAALYVIHGMLHLGGWNDLRSADAKKMARQQEQIFKTARQML